MKRLFLIGLGLLALAAENLIVINLAQHATRDRINAFRDNEELSLRMDVERWKAQAERKPFVIYRDLPATVPLSTFMQRQQAVEAQQALVRATEEQAWATRRLAEQAETDAMERQQRESWNEINRLFRK